MPSNILAFDSNFPSFTGKESPEQQIRALHNYLFQLREGLQYSLQNLTADNFNTAALQNLTDAQKNEVAIQLEKVYGMLNQLSGEIDSLSGRVSGTEDISGRVAAAESQIDYLDKRTTEAEDRVDALERAAAECEADRTALDSRVAEIEEEIPRLEQAADELAELQEDVYGEGGLQARTQALEDTVTGKGGLQEQMQTVTQDLGDISGTVQVADDGSATLGSEGKVLRLVGQVYINGVLIEQGGTT